MGQVQKLHLQSCYTIHPVLSKSDLEYVLGTKIRDKAEFIDRCNQIGLLIIDISPFALNTEDTTINYRRKSKLNPHGITKREYRLLIQETLPTFFDCK